MNRFGMIIGSILGVVGVLLVGYAVHMHRVAGQPPVSQQPTNVQIFQEVSTQLGLKRNQLEGFTLFGPDKVAFAIGPDNIQTKGLGIHFAYKQDGRWHDIYAGQEVADCQTLSAVPERYRPKCYDYSQQTATGQLPPAQYTTSSGDNLNYPTSQATPYL